MEHITITDIGGGYYHLTPDEGYTLYNVRTSTFHSDAETKNLNEWVAVTKEAV
jgi:hypothetical protein